MRRLLFFLFVLAAVASCYAVAGPSSLINNIPNRTTVSLNGSWHYIVDPYETGLKARFYLDAKSKDKQELVEYDFDKSDVLNVPGDWNTQKKELFFYEGPSGMKNHFLTISTSTIAFSLTSALLTISLASFSMAMRWVNTREVSQPSTSKSRTRFTTATIF